MMQILAQQVLSRPERLRSMQNQFKEPDSDAGMSILWFLGLLAAFMLLIWLLSFLQARYYRQIRPQPQALFRRVQQRMGLSIWYRWRIRQMVRVVQPEQPTALLISPQMFDQAVEKYCQTSGWLGSRAATAQEFAEIRAILFGSANPDADAVAVNELTAYNSA